MTDKRLTPEDAAKLTAAVIGDGDLPEFMSAMPEQGDVALVLKHGGGMQILSVMADNPNPTTLGSLGMRGLFAIALFKIAHDAELMASVLQTVSGQLEGSTPKLDS